MASMRDIKRRRDSIASTGQITKAMKLVSTVKLQKAKTRAENSRPFSEMMYETVCNVLARSSNVNHRFLVPNGSEKKGVIVITANRGLAGGYNTNITKLITNGGIAASEAVVYAVGRKGKEILLRKGYNVREDFSDVINEPLYSDAIHICEKVLKAYTDGEIGEIYIAYTGFKNTVVHEPKLLKLLPVDADEHAAGDESDVTPMNYEPEEDEALDIIIPKYINSLIYGALIQSVASENGARMQAMDSATSNAEDMISSLSLKFNRARQASITQEITEIIAGASAIS